MSLFSKSRRQPKTKAGKLVQDAQTVRRCGAPLEHGGRCDKPRGHWNTSDHK